MEITSALKQDFLTFSDDETLSSMMGKLKKFEKHSGLVFRNNKYLGLVEKKKWVRPKIDVSKAKLSPFVQKTPILNEHADIIGTANLMFQSNTDFLPVERNKQIFAVLNAIDLLNLAMKLDEVKGLKISDVKLVKSRKIDKKDPISMVIDVMYKERVDQVPLFDKGKLYGIISYKDLMRKYLNWSPKRDISTKFNISSRAAEADRPQLANLPVSSFSTNDNLVTLNIGRSLKHAVKLMATKNISDVIVTDSSGVKGLLTVRNILAKIGGLKIQRNFNIKFVGLKDADLDAYQRENIKKIAANESFKLQRQLKNEFTLVLHVKDYSKSGKQHKFSVNLRIESPGQIVTSTQSDWRIETAVRKTFNNAKNKLRSKFRN